MGDSGGGAEEPGSDRKRQGCSVSLGEGLQGEESASAPKRHKPSANSLSSEGRIETSDGLPKPEPISSPLEDFTSLSLLLPASDPESSDQGGPMVGKLHTDGSSPSEDDRVGTNGRIRKVEYIRLIEQALLALGYSKSARLLELESKVQLESGPVSSLRAAVLAGKWDESTRILHSFADVTSDALRQAKFLLQQQKFLEFLEASDATSALLQLRCHVAPLCGDKRRLHQLASWLMCTSREDLLNRSGWQGTGEASRQQLMGELQALLPPTLMIPDRRLECIVEDALERQEAECGLHNYPLDSLTLFSDHDCGRSQIPSVTTQVLDDHDDEVWFVQFSHDGTRLASASKDCRSLIWEIEDEFTSRVQHVLAGHTGALSFVAWSPDDSMLLSCSSDHLVKLWDTATGACLHTYRKHKDPVSACAWFPCGRRFASVAPIKTGPASNKSLYVWDVEGNEVPDWYPCKGGSTSTSSSSPSSSPSPIPQHLLGGRINDVAISHDGRHMVTICSDNKVMVHNLETGAVQLVQEPKSVTSLSLSLDSSFALVNISTGAIHLWNLEAVGHTQDALQQPSFQYRGQVQGRFVIRSCFGGSHQLFIVSGSEDSQVYIWHRPTGEILQVLPGHAGTVNAVSWPASRPLMFASASDDGTIRIWGLKSCKPPEGVRRTTTNGLQGSQGNGTSGSNGFAH